MTELRVAGRINSDGRIEMYKEELNAFLAKHKGQKVIATFQVPSKNTSQALRGYYYSYIVPTFRKAIWQHGERLTDQQTEERLRRLSPVMYEQKADYLTGRYHTRIRHISELDNAELIEHIETLKQIGAEEYSIYIEDPQ